MQNNLEANFNTFGEEISAKSINKYDPLSNQKKTFQKKITAISELQTPDRDRSLEEKEGQF